MYTTFPTCADHTKWIQLGSAGWQAEVGPTYGAEETVSIGGMPGFQGKLTEDQAKRSEDLLESLQKVQMDARAKMMNPEDDLSMEILRRAEKMANEAYPEAVRDHNKESVLIHKTDNLRLKCLNFC